MSAKSLLRWAFLAVAVLAVATAAFAQIGIAITIGPPALPVYEQPICPGEGYLWVPGYWAYDYDDADYYWVPGTWVLPPDAGLLWTPPYWAWDGDAFIFYDGYWGPAVGFYGGIAYGFGYFGVGFDGGRWENGRFFYNQAVTNVNVTTIHYVYNQPVANSAVVSRVSYNGGNGGINARPTPQEQSAARAGHVPPVQAQREQMQTARGDRRLRASSNHGKPPVAATPKPADFKGHVVAAREAGAPYNPRVNSPQGTRAGNNPGRQAVHPNDLPPAERPGAPDTGNAKLDKKYEQQRETMLAQQEKERQNLQQKQTKEHAQLEKQKADESRKQMVEQRHQEQTAQMQQRQAQQMQKLREKQQPPAMHSQARPPKPVKPQHD